MFVDEIFLNFFTPFVPFIVLKTNVSQNRLKIQTILGRDSNKNDFLNDMPNQTNSQYWFLSNISVQAGLFFKPIFALKSCV